MLGGRRVCAAGESEVVPGFLASCTTNPRSSTFGFE